MGFVFYKMPADILEVECIQKMLQEKGALSQFGLVMLMWFSIMDTRDGKMPRCLLMNMFKGISSTSQRKKVLDSGIFCYDASTDSFSLCDEVLHTGVHTGMHTGMHTPVHTPVHTPNHLGKDLKEEERENTHTHTHAEVEDFSDSLIRDLKNSRVDRGEVWEGVLLCCPDQKLRKLMMEHWPETVDFVEKHLRSSGRIAEVKNLTSLCDVMRSMVQPNHPFAGGLKLFLEQEAKSDTEKAFDQWYATLSNVHLMELPLTYGQFEELVQMGFPPLQVKATLERLNNSTTAYRRYSSAFVTAKDWLEHPRGMVNGK